MIKGLPTDLEAFVQQEVADGKYRSTEEVICAGLRSLCDREQELEHIAKKLRPTIAEVRSGHPGVEFDVDDIVKRGMERLAAKHTKLWRAASA